MRSRSKLLPFVALITVALSTFLLVARPAATAAASSRPSDVGASVTFEASPTELVFIDPTVRHTDVLLAGLTPAVTPIMLTADRDGIEQISEELRRHHDLTAVHIVSEGAPGSVHLGNAWLSRETFDLHRSKLATWGSALAEGGDLLFWGCAVGQGDAGADLLDRIAAMTGADVAASTNDTGAGPRGADWILESTRGTVTAVVPFTATTLDTYLDVLGEVQVRVFGRNAPAGATFKWMKTGSGGVYWQSIFGNTGLYATLSQSPLADQAETSYYTWKIVWNPVGSCTIKSDDNQTNESNVRDYHTETYALWATYSNCDITGTPSSISNASVPENQAAGTLVGTFSNTAAAGQALTFQLVTGEGSTHNASFTINGDKLLTTQPLDYEADNHTRYIRVKTTGTSLTREDIFTLTLTDNNDDPTDIRLFSGSAEVTQGQVAENSSIPTTIVTFAAVDQDEGDSHSFELVPSVDSSRFTISGSTLMATDVFDRETKSSYSVTVRAKDKKNAQVQKTFTVVVTNVNEAPTVAFSKGTFIYDGSGADIVDAGALVSDVDADVSPTFNTGVLVARLTPGGTATAAETLAVQHQGTGSNQIGVSGAEITYNGHSIGTFSGGTGGTNLSIILTQYATPESVQALLRALTYQSTTLPIIVGRGIEVTLKDSASGLTSDAASIAVSGQNTPPVVTVSSTPLAFTEGDPAIVVAPDATVADADSVNFDGGHLIVSVPSRLKATDHLAIKSQGSGPGQIGVFNDVVLYGGQTIGTFSGGSPATTDLDVTLNSSATPLAVTALIRAVTFNVTVTAPPAATHNVRFTVSDGDGATSTAVSVPIQVRPINRAPVISDIPDQTVVQGASLEPVGFTVTDALTGASALAVTATSSNTTLVPNDKLTLESLFTGVIRTIAATPLPGQVGQTTITVTVSDGELSSSDTFVLTVAPANTAPTISDVPDKTIAQDGTLGPLDVVVADAETATGSLVVTATSSNTDLVPNNRLGVAFANGTWSVTATPLAGAFGQTTITLTVSDGDLAASDTFVLTVTPTPVTPANAAPTISDIPNQTIAQGTSLPAISFTVGDDQISAAALTVTATSSNTDVLPNAGITLGGNGGTRTIAATPASGRAGDTTVTVKVSDGTLTAQDTFVLTVTPAPVQQANRAPTISTSQRQLTIGPGNTNNRVEITVGDAETAPAALAVSATSSTQVVLSGGLVFSGTGANRTLTITPAPNAAGPTTLTITVSDGTSSATATVDVNVQGQAATQPSGSSCADRSRVTTRPDGPGRMKATITAQGSGNTISGVRFEQGTNVRIIVNNAPVSGPFPASVPLTGAEVSFIVERVTAGQATHLPFSVTDACGTWPSFVGGGANAY